MPDALNDILMITHRRPDYTRLALGHLLDTCDDRCRVWLWHNGDDVETRAVIDEFVENPAIWRVRMSPDNVGQHTPLRWMFDNGEADLVTKVDDDCLMPPGWVETLRDAHRDVPEFGAIGCWRFPEELFEPEVAARKIRAHGEHLLLHNAWVEGSGFVLKRAAIDRHGPMDAGTSFPKYCLRLAREGWVNGWYFPFLYQEHMDHPWSEHTMFRSDEDLARLAPLNAERWGVTTIEEYAQRFRDEAHRLQAADPDPGRYTGVRGRLRQSLNLLRPSHDRGMAVATPVEEFTARLRDRHQPGLRLYHRSPWVTRGDVSERPIIVIGGAERSGTTLLRAAVDSHPDVAIGPEAWVFVYRLKLEFLASEYDIPVTTLQRLRLDSRSLTTFVDGFAGLVCDHEGASVWGEKSPQNVERIAWIFRHFPNTRFIHIVRDGRDVACSLRTHPQRVRIGSAYHETNVDRPIDECIATWARAVRAGMKHRADPRYLEVRYEDLVSDYESATRRVVEHCGLDWRPDLLDRERIQSGRPDTEIVNPEVRGPLYTSALARWRTDLSDDVLVLIEDQYGSLLEEMGYSLAG